MYYLGIEIGGTKLQLGIGQGDGVLAGLWRETVVVADGPEGIRRQITRAVPELLAKSGIDRAQLRAVGIGFGGPVDDNTRTVIKSHQIEGWDNFPLADWISDVVKLPAVLGNDADCAGLAEALFGAGKGLSPIFYITIGSGIGGGLIINGEVYRGCGRGAAEIGHLRTRAWWFAQTPTTLLEHREEIKLRLPETGPLEEFASGWAIGRCAQIKASHKFDHMSPLYRLVYGKPERITASVLAEAAAQGDHFARTMLGETISYLADAITHVIALLCPRRIVVGGGVSLIGEKLLFQPLRQLVAQRVFLPFADCYDIVPAALGETVVVHGALALARRKLPS
jgi:glucokinase